MKQYIIIEADINDGDYVTKKTEITEEEIIKIEEIVVKMPRQKDYEGIEKKCIRYETREIGNDDKNDSEYKYITNEEKRFLAKFLPSGDYNYTGIHTIESIDIVSESKKIL